MAFVSPTRWMCSKQARKWNGCSALEVALIDPSFPGDDITTIVTFDLRIITFLVPTSLSIVVDWLSVRE